MLDPYYFSQVKWVYCQIYINISWTNTKWKIIHSSTNDNEGCWSIAYWSLDSSIPIWKEAWWRLVDGIRVRRDYCMCVVCCKCSMCKKSDQGCVCLINLESRAIYFLIINILLVYIHMLLLNSYNLIYCRRSYGGSQRWIQEFYDVTLCFQRAYVTSCLAGWFGRLHHLLILF